MLLFIKIIPSVAVRLSQNEQIVINLFDNHESITRKDVEKVLSVSQAMAVRVLKELVVKSAVRPLGAGKNTRYVIVK
jgi:ATP-dependent DNA helicase RecG